MTGRDDKFKLTWFPFYPEDFTRDTMHLDATGTGAYLMLLIAYYAGGRPLLDNDLALRTICKMSEGDWGTYRPLIAYLFQPQDGMWFHKRCEHELDKAYKVHRDSVEGGKKGAKKRYGAIGSPIGGPKATPKAIPYPSPNGVVKPDLSPHPQPHPYTSTSTIDKIDKKEEPLASLAGPARDEPSKAPPRLVLNMETKSEPKKRKRPIPSDWRPTQEHANLCVSLGYDPTDMEEHFRSVCASNGYLYLDHDAAFRNFIRNQKNFQRSSNGVRQNNSPNRGSIVHAADVAIAHLEREIAADNEMREGSFQLLPKP